MFLGGEYAWLISHQQASRPACFSTASSSIPHPMGDSWLATYHWLWSSASLGKRVRHSLVAAESRVPLASPWLLDSVPYWCGCCRKLIRCLDGAVDASTIHTYILLSPNSWRDGRKPPELHAPATNERRRAKIAPIDDASTVEKHPLYGPVLCPASMPRCS